MNVDLSVLGVLFSSNQHYLLYPRLTNFTPAYPFYTSGPHFLRLMGLTIFLNRFNLFATLINFLSFSVEHLQAMAQKQEGRNFVPQGEFVLWLKVGPDAMVQEHVFKLLFLGGMFIAILTFIRELIVVVVV